MINRTEDEILALKELIGLNIYDSLRESINMNVRDVTIRDVFQERKVDEKD